MLCVSDRVSKSVRVCVCPTLQNTDYLNVRAQGVCLRARERKLERQHFCSFSQLSREGCFIKSKHNLSPHTHRYMGTDWALVSESTWPVKDNPKGKQRANETLMSWSRINWSLLQPHLCTASMSLLCSQTTNFSPPNQNDKKTPDPSKKIPGRKQTEEPKMRMYLAFLFQALHLSSLTVLKGYSIGSAKPRTTEWQFKL